MTGAFLNHLFFEEEVRHQIRNNDLWICVADLMRYLEITNLHLWRVRDEWKCQLPVPTPEGQRLMEFVNRRGLIKILMLLDSSDERIEALQEWVIDTLSDVITL